MKALNKFTAVAAPLNGSNIDTDRIIPARFLKKLRDTDHDFARWLFHDVRYDDDGNPIADFVLNQPRFQNAGVLIADENFACGSSREGAVYALLDAGIRVIAAPSFGEIFASNCARNGVAAVIIEAIHADQLRALLAQPTQVPDPTLTVDIERGEISAPFCDPIPFTLDAFARHCLQNGLDEIDVTLEHAETIERYETKRMVAQPWLFSGKP